MRRKHKSLATERIYVFWLRRFMTALFQMPAEMKSEQKIEQFLTELALKDVAASTQNQAFNAILFFYRDVMKVELNGIDALRATRPDRIRHAEALSVRSPFEGTYLQCYPDERDGLSHNLRFFGRSSLGMESNFSGRGFRLSIGDGDHKSDLLCWCDDIEPIAIVGLAFDRNEIGFDGSDCENIKLRIPNDAQYVYSLTLFQLLLKNPISKHSFGNNFRTAITRLRHWRRYF